MIIRFYQHQIIYVHCYWCCILCCFYIWYLIDKRDQATMSCWGIPSVMHTIKSNSASSASITALAAKGGGTYITVALALASTLASATELKTGSPKCLVPPFLGVTPPTYLCTKNRIKEFLMWIDLFLNCRKRKNINIRMYQLDSGKY